MWSNALFIYLFLFLLQILIQAYEEKFIGRISFDDIAYGSINVPSCDSQAIKLTLWAQPYISPIYALFGVGRIPTVDDYDDIIELPSLPQSLQLLEYNPPQGKIFIGFWGGKMLRSYRYFAGERKTSAVGFQFVLDNNCLKVGDDKSIFSLFMNQDYELQRKEVMNINGAKQFSLFIYPGSELITISFSIQVNNYQCYPDDSQSDLVLVLRFLFSSISEDDPYLNEGFRTSKLVRKYHLCDPVYMSSQAPSVSIDVNFPTAGRWTALYSLLEADAYNPLISSVQTSRHQRRWQPIVSVVNTTLSSTEVTTDRDDANVQSSPVSLFTSNLTKNESNKEIISVVQWQIKDGKSSLVNKVHDMNVVFANDRQQEYVGTSVPIFPISNKQKYLFSNQSIENFVRSPIYTVTIPASPGFAAANLFGGMIVQLLLRVNSHQHEILAKVQRLPWTVAMRLGNIPFLMEQKEAGESPGNTIWVADNLFHSNSSQPLPSRCSMDQLSYISKSNPHLHVLRYDWYWSRPALQHFQALQDLADASRRVYLRLLLQDPAADSDMWDVIEELQAQSITIDAQLKLTADPCGALGGNTPCAHRGRCVISATGTLSLPSPSVIGDTGGDDVRTAQCICSYPWAGTHCTNLAVPIQTYVWEVLVLVLSNAAMLPAVLLSVHYRLYLLTVGLCASSLSSAVYHLCDTEVYCIGELSFASLHVLDVLFSVAMIASVMLFLAPISREVHAGLSLGVVSLLVAPVIDNPTNALVLVLTVALSISVVLVLWSRHLHQVHILANPVVATTNLPTSSSFSLGQDAGPIYASLPLHDDRSHQESNTTTTSTTSATSSDRLRRNSSNIPDRHSHADRLNHRGVSSIARSDVGDVEMEILSTRTNILHDDSSFHISGINGDSDAMSIESVESAVGASSVASGAATTKPATAPAAVLSVTTLLRQSRDIVIAMGIGMIGLLSYALDNRTNYWYVHSLWHTCIMTSAFFLLRGRMHIFDYFSIETEKQ